MGKSVNPDDHNEPSGAEEEVEVQQTVKPLKLPGIIDNKHYKVLRSGAVKNNVTTIYASCLHCKGGKEISGDTKSTGNFLKHLQKLHPTQYTEYQKRKREVPECELADGVQKRIKQFCPVVSVSSGLKTSVEKYVTDYIVNSMKPLSTVDDPYFRLLLKRVSQNPQLPIQNQKSLRARISTDYSKTVAHITSRIKPLDYICLTADCWSSHSRAFIGVTAHWIKSDFSRESVVLACSRFKGTHSFDKIADKLNSIMNNYSIRIEQVVAIVTDNGSNFCKAFREFGIEFDDKSFQRDSDDDGDPDERNSSDLESSDEEDAVEQDLEAIFEGGNTESRKLPPHFRCTSHTLSLVATKDGLQVKDKRLYHVAMAKCTKLWNLSSSPKSSEVIRDICGISLKRPAPTRWNSLYDSLECLLRVEKHLDKMCADLNVPVFQAKEIEFLKEFVKISKPVAVALDKMQGEYGVFMGSLIPTLLRVKAMLNEMKDDSQHCKAFIIAYLTGIESRFGNLMTIDPTNPSDYVLASLTHPVFKLRWVPVEFQEKLKKQLVLKAKLFSKVIARSQDSVVEDDVDPFYDFKDTLDIQSEVETQVCSVELECIRYLNDTSRKLLMLQQYPTIEKMFRRYNTPLPSSAPVERVFSYAGLILSPRRTGLTDANFEKLVLLKCNTIFQLE